VSVEGPSISGGEELKVETCADWESVARKFESFPTPKFLFDDDGMPTETVWIFRGHKSYLYELKPSIEREVYDGSQEWGALELRLLREFQAKARLFAGGAYVVF
jgi:hypothetical protein